MKRTNVLLKIAVLRESLAAKRTAESFFSIVNSANVSVDAATCTESFVTSWTLVFVCFVSIVKSIDVIAQPVVLAESLQTNLTLRSIRSIENTWLLKDR